MIQKDRERRMRLDELRTHLHKHPFIPIRVFISDGSHYDVHDRDFMLLSRREVVIGLDPGSDNFPERNAYVDPVHITRIEPINGKRTGAPRRKPKGHDREA